MNGISSAIWGGLGGFAVEVVQIYGAMQRAKRPPWRSSGQPPGVGDDPTLDALALSVAIRMVVGTILAAAAGESGQVSGALGAMAVGVAAPLVIQQMAREVPIASTAQAQAPPGLEPGPAPTPTPTPGEAGADA
jgi:hypothetical protein